MTIVRIDPLSDRRWIDTEERFDATLFHSRPWLASLAETYGFAPSAYIAVEPDGAVAGGVPFCEIDDAAGHRIVALPFSDACPILAANDDIEGQSVAALQSHRVPVHILGRVRASPAAENTNGDIRARAQQVAVQQPEEMWKTIAPATRRAIRKAERSNVVVRPLDDSALDKFYELHVALRKRKFGLLPQPRAFFDALRGQFMPQGGWWPLGAFRADRLIGAAIFLRWRETLAYKFNASALDALDARPNSLLVWHGLQLAAEIDCQTVDLGLSPVAQPGLVRFKAGFGAVASDLGQYRWTPPAFSDHAVSLRRTFRQMAHALTSADVPDEQTARAGGMLYRFFA